MHIRSDSSDDVRRGLVLLLGILTLGTVDVVVLERIYKPISQVWHVPWRAFSAPLPVFGSNSPVLWWHVAFVPLGLCLFLLVGLAARDGRLAAAGCVLFATGWEDLAYYVLQLRLPPGELPWLDAQPGIAWTRWVLRSPHVTRTGLLVACIVGGLAAARLLRWIGSRTGRRRAAHGDAVGRNAPNAAPGAQSDLQHPTIAGEIASRGRPKPAAGHGGLGGRLSASRARSSTRRLSRRSPHHARKSLYIAQTRD